MISRLVESLDPRWMQTYLTTEPVPEEQLRPFLWRFWIKTPEKGHIALFDQRRGTGPSWWTVCSSVSARRISPRFIAKSSSSNVRV